MKEHPIIVSGGIAIVKLSVWYFRHFRLAQVQRKKIGHHINLRPIVIVHLPNDFQPTHIIQMIYVIKDLRPQTSGFQ